MTEDFDLAVYIKGDKKPTTIYSATLLLDYEGADGEPISSDLVVNIIEVIPSVPSFDQEFTVKFSISNVGNEAKEAAYTVRYTDNKGGQWTDKSASPTTFVPDETMFYEWKYNRPALAGNKGNLQAKVTVTVPPDQPPDEDNNDTIDFQIKKKKK